MLRLFSCLLVWWCSSHVVLLFGKEKPATDLLQVFCRLFSLEVISSPLTYIRTTFARNYAGNFENSLPIPLRVERVNAFALKLFSPILNETNAASLGLYDHALRLVFYQLTQLLFYGSLKRRINLL